MPAAARLSSADSPVAFPDLEAFVSQTLAELGEDPDQTPAAIAAVLRDNPHLTPETGLSLAQRHALFERIVDVIVAETPPVPRPVRLTAQAVTPPADTPAPAPPADSENDTGLLVEALDALVATRRSARQRHAQAEITTAPTKKKLAEMAAYGAALIAHGRRGIDRWSAAMRAAYGSDVDPHLGALRHQAKALFDKMVEATTGDLPNTKRLLALWHGGEDARDWYGPAKAEISAIFGKDADTFIDFVAATSPLRNVDVNLQHAIKAFKQWKLGHPFHGFVRTHEKSLNQIARHEEWGGPKTRNFAKAIKGDADAVVVDTWIMRAFGFKKNSPGINEYRFVSGLITLTAQELGVTPREVQAALWVAMKRETGDLNTAAPLHKVLKDVLARMLGTGRVTLDNLGLTHDQAAQLGVLPQSLPTEFGFEPTATPAERPMPKSKTRPPTAHAPRGPRAVTPLLFAPTQRAARHRHAAGIIEKQIVLFTVKLREAEAEARRFAAAGDAEMRDHWRDQARQAAAFLADLRAHQAKQKRAGFVLDGGVSGRYSGGTMSQPTLTKRAAQAIIQKRVARAFATPNKRAQLRHLRAATKAALAPKRGPVALSDLS